jgi:protein phosphatase PTC6
VGWRRHGTDQVSHYLRDNLHTLIESSQKSQIPEVVKSYREIGGYLRRFKGGQLERLINDKGTDTKEEEKMGLDDSMSLAFLQVSSHFPSHRT